MGHQHAGRGDVDDRDVLLQAIAVSGRSLGGRSAVMSVPGASARCEFRMRTGMLRATAGRIVPGAAPWRRSTPARTLRRTTGAARPAASATIRGSAVSMPSTSVQIWISSAPRQAPTIAAGVVRAAAAERGGHAVGGGADEAAQHRDAAGSEERVGQCASSAAVVSGKQRRRAGVVAVGHDRLARVDPRAVEAVRGQRRGHDAAADDLAGGGNRIEPARRHLAQHAQARRRCARARRTRGRCRPAPRAAAPDR